jgi:hypothetical protein
MGAIRPRDRAELLVEFAEVDRDDATGARVHVQCEFCSVPERKDIPKLRDPHEHPFGLRTDYLRSHNANYYRELAEYELMTRLCRKVRVTVKNIGEVAANNVRVELVVPARMRAATDLRHSGEAGKGRDVGGQDTARDSLGAPARSG